MKIKFMHSKTGHWGRATRVMHGPRTWPWWRVASVKFVRLEIKPPSSGYRLWVYTRWGAWCGDIYIDRRPA
jgi:hypothetical protein